MSGYPRNSPEGTVMTEEQGRQAIGEGEKLCPHCGQAVPHLHYCVRCGTPLDGTARRHEFAAHPGEPVQAIRPFSTLFPHLPDAGYHSFRAAFVVGLALVALLVIAGFYPVALVAAAILVPILFVLYFIEADLYERAPLTIIVATLAWAFAVGALLGAAVRLAGSSASVDSGASLAGAIPGAIGLALLGAALATLGPLALIRHRAFNDVLDGATFGAISGAVYASTYGVVRASDLLMGGLRPGGDPWPWLARLATLGVAQPVLLATIVGSVCAAFWLRYRAPINDRRALGPLGLPLVTIVAAVVLLAVSAAARVQLPLLAGLVVTAVAAALGLLWLRGAIHLGLLEEANESGIGPPTRCLNCGRMTPGHTFCGWCGISLQALPKSTRTKTPAAQPAPGQRSS
jgi:rRNA maturation endonuclease Nob1